MEDSEQLTTHTSVTKQEPFPDILFYTNNYYKVGRHLDLYYSAVFF